MSFFMESSTCDLLATTTVVQLTETPAMGWLARS
jgi:hypothetical protein